MAKETENNRADWNYRNFSFRAATLNEAERSVEAVIASEAPVPMWDWRAGEHVPEVLLMSGLKMPATRQIPLLDSHARYDLSDQLGSIRSLRVDGDTLVGRLHFSSLSEEAWTKVREGHVTDISGGYRIHNKVRVEAGAKTSIKGRTFEGPINVVTEWSIKEGSILPIGADELAKLRGVPHGFNQRFTMDKKLRELLVSRGMPAELDDAAAQTWLGENGERAFPLPAPKEDPKPEPKAAPEPEKRVEKSEGSTIDEVVARALKSYADQQAQQRREFRAEVDSLLKIARRDDLKDRCYALEDVKAVRELIVKEQEAEVVDIGRLYISAGPAQSEKHRGMVDTALTMRALTLVMANDKTVKELLPEDKRTKGWEELRHASLLDLATECLHMDGVRTFGWSRERIARAALGDRQALIGRAAPAYHTTGSFPDLTLNAVNKSLLAGYVEAPSTWRGPMYQGSSVADFKLKRLIRLGEVPNLKVIQDNVAPHRVSFDDEKESAGVEAYGAMTDFSWKLLVNDDMDALSRTPRMFGDASARTINAVAWNVITSNPTMVDGQPLFSDATGNRKKDNLTGSGAAPSVAQLQITGKLMRLQVGVNTPEGNASDAILGLIPRYIVGPAALATTIQQLVLSAYDPAANLVQVYNPANQLIPVIEPLLDANSATAWYLFASPSQIPTVEVFFLQGQESPQVRTWMDEETLSQKFAVLQSFAAKAVDHRGVAKDAGA
jgi:hypothetical protein